MGDSRPEPGLFGKLLINVNSVKIPCDPGEGVHVCLVARSAKLLDKEAAAIGETAGGDLSGIQHLPPAAILGALLWVGWRHPLAAGTVLLALAVPLGVAYIVVLVSRSLPPTWALIVVLPPVVTGWLLVRAGRHERQLP